MEAEPSTWSTSRPPRASTNVPTTPTGLRIACSRPGPICARDDPDQRLADLTGDGLADVLILRGDSLTWHESLGEEGYGQPADARRDPAIVFADGTDSVFLADLSGDGLSDLVHIRNGDILYWPNLGYGRFGTEVVMADAPILDAPEASDARRIRLADIDGSGPTDLIYLAGGGTRAYLNRSGNAWSEAIAIAAFPPIDELTTVEAVDLLGNGIGPLVHAFLGTQPGWQTWLQLHQGEDAATRRPPTPTPRSAACWTAWSGLPQPRPQRQRRTAGNPHCVRHRGQHTRGDRPDAPHCPHRELRHARHLLLAATVTSSPPCPNVELGSNVWDENHVNTNCWIDHGGSCISHGGSAPCRHRQAQGRSLCRALTIGAYKGYYICGTRADSYRYADGRIESFVMGMDYAVWPIWQRWNGDAQWSGWHSLGGRLQWPRPGAGVVVNSVYTTTNRPVISAIGLDNALWCNAFDPDVVRWSGWYPC